MWLSREQVLTGRVLIGHRPNTHVPSRVWRCFFGDMEVCSGQQTTSLPSRPRRDGKTRHGGGAAHRCPGRARPRRHRRRASPQTDEPPRCAHARARGSGPCEGGIAPGACSRNATVRPAAALARRNRAMEKKSFGSPRCALPKTHGAGYRDPVLLAITVLSRKRCFYWAGSPRSTFP